MEKIQFPRELDVYNGSAGRWVVQRAGPIVDWVDWGAGVLSRLKSLVHVLECPTMQGVMAGKFGEHLTFLSASETHTSLEHNAWGIYVDRHRHPEP